MMRNADEDRQAHLFERAVEVLGSEEGKRGGGWSVSSGGLAVPFRSNTRRRSPVPARSKRFLVALTTVYCLKVF